MPSMSTALTFSASFEGKRIITQRPFTNMFYSFKSYEQSLKDWMYAGKRREMEVLKRLHTIGGFMSYMAGSFRDFLFAFLHSKHLLKTRKGKDLFLFF